IHHRSPGYAVEDPGGDGRREEDSVAGQEEVLARAFGDVAVHVQHQRLVVAGGDGFLLGQHAVQVLAASLGDRDEALAADPSPRRDSNPDAVTDPLVAQVGAPFPGGDAGAHLGGGGVETDGSQGVEHQGPDVTGLEAVGPYHLPARLHDLVYVVVPGDAVGPGRATQTLDVLAETEDGGAVRGSVGPDPF